MKRKNLVSSISIALFSFYLTGCNDSDHKENNSHIAEQQKPNVLFIMADDLGYSDLGAFGGEIHTPNLDALTNEGRILTDYHTAPTCSPTRSQLLSGTDHHQAGIGAMAELTPAHLKGQPGYEGYLNNHSLSLAEVLHDNGYRTYISGKWHLGLTPETNAKARGFDHSFTLLQGFDLHYKQAPTGYKRNATYTEDGQEVPITKLPDDYFSTNYYTDKLLQYLDSGKDSKQPFFAYAAYTAPHWPIQAPKAFSDRYKGVYDVGYDTIREARLAKQKQLGIIPNNFSAAIPIDSQNAPAKLGKWNELTTEQKAIEARKMEIYAGMVENLDYNIGRIIQHLKVSGQYENTLIFFVSDNGAEGSAGSANSEAQVDNSLTGLGTENSYTFIGPRWAEVSSTPFHLWKGTAGEGATTAPAIVKFPNQKGSESKYHGFASVLDVLPTVLEYANIAVPKDQYKGRQINNPIGYSWKSTLENKSKTIRPIDFSFADELHGSKYAKQGDWKIALQANANLGTSKWELYNIKDDRGERNNLADVYPDQVGKLIEVYNKYTQQNGVLEYKQ
ncbi:arylsulfatase [Acinetobacter sp. ANC 4470]|uniref:arylsulfatase n=1 Tax=Acinetobacter sp. ANC 4470 TaxID=1977881 RepID=UPI000A33B86E|nr:arylsulfatase [Acinetobacter sp. ANC 4470]OTG69210.1 arylsulfatase [Acinetobacter sp. ANC 4470]